MSTDEEEPIGVAQFAGAQRDVERLLEENVTSWSIVNAVWTRFNAAKDAAGPPLEAAQPPADEGTDASRKQRIEALAEHLCHVYHYGVGLAELDEEDPQQARVHRRAARRLERWLAESPEKEVREERRAAFRRGYDRGRENQKRSTAEQVQQLEATVAELRQERDPEGLRARIADLQYVARGYRRMHIAGADLRADLADALNRLEAAQLELAALKGVQPSNATGERPS